jgi:hypothetical protein
MKKPGTSQKPNASRAPKRASGKSKNQVVPAFNPNQSAQTAALVFRAAAELVPYARNARTHSKAQIVAIAESIEARGWTSPVLVDGERGSRNIIAGHGRVLAAARLYSAGKTIRMADGARIPVGAVPVMYALGWTEAERRAYIIADNKLALDAGWDIDLLKTELQALKLDGFDLKFTGFGSIELDELFAEPGADGDVYSRKLDPPIYSPKGDRPPVASLVDMTKADELHAEIAADKKLPADVALFLHAAADRHAVFDFHAIAEFYCHAPAKTQRLMERSALVIIDFNAAIEGGFVRLTDELRALSFEVDGAAPADEETAADA